MRASERREGRGRRAAACAFASAMALTTPFHAGAAEAKGLSVELNKLESQGKGCRVYLVVDNPTDAALPVFKLDLIFFRPDGVIDRRLALDLGPVRPTKKSVKSFDLDTLPCDGIGSVLVNDVIDCREGGNAVADCLSRLSVASRAAVTLSK